MPLATCNFLITFWFWQQAWIWKQGQRISVYSFHYITRKKLLCVLANPGSATVLRILPSNTSRRNPLCHNNTWPIHLCLWHRIVFNIFLSSWTIFRISSFVFLSTQLFFCILQIHISKASNLLELLLSAYVNVQLSMSLQHTVPHSKPDTLFFSSAPNLICLWTVFSYLALVITIISTASICECDK